MDKKRIIIGDKQYTVEIAKTEEDRKKGLQDREQLAPDEGMLKGHSFDKPYYTNVFSSSKHFAPIFARSVQILPRFLQEMPPFLRYSSCNDF